MRALLLKKQQLQQQNQQNQSGENKPKTLGNLSPIAIGRLQGDYEKYENVPECEYTQVNPKDIQKFKLVIRPQVGMYKGGVFEFSLDYPNDYPHAPPKVHCLTQVYHPNIDLEGHVCLSLLRIDKEFGWTSTRTMYEVVTGLLFLFHDPNPEDPLNIPAGEAMKRDIDEFERTVKRTLKGGNYFGKQFPRFI